MPSQERFRARPMGRASNRVLQVKITSFGLDSSRSRKSVVKICSHTSFSGHRGIEGTVQVIMQAAIFAAIFADISARPVGCLHSQQGGQQTLAARQPAKPQGKGLNAG